MGDHHKRDEWLQDIEARQRNVVFPDTVQNEARFWRNVGKQPFTTSTKVGLAGRSLEEIRDELERLMLEQVESLKAQTFGGLSQEELRKQDERLKRIREVSADFLSALKNA
jgi:hypothetical protein